MPETFEILKEGTPEEGQPQKYKIIIYKNCLNRQAIMQEIFDREEIITLEQLQTEKMRCQGLVDIVDQKIQAAQAL
ncbi:MAG: hypothetical protein ABSB18_06405 [Candidatus Omnitrophota bacterium]